MTSTTAQPYLALPVATPDLERQAQRVAWQLTALMVALLLPTALGVLFDARLTHGVNGWVKPLKFEISLAIHFATLGLLLGFVAPEVRAGRVIRWSMLAAAVISVLEVAYILVQAGRARASHFNNDTQLETTAYNLMGAGASIIVVCAFIAGVVLWRHPRPGVSPEMRLAAGGGLMFAGLSTLAIGIFMGSNGAHWVGTPSNGGFPIMGWSTVGGDLRVPHFFATHAAQVTPLFVLGWQRFRGDDARAPVAIFLVVYAIFTLAVFVQALLGLPFIPWR